MILMELGKVNNQPTVRILIVYLLRVHKSVQHTFLFGIKGSKPKCLVHLCHKITNPSTYWRDIIYVTSFSSI